MIHSKIKLPTNCFIGQSDETEKLYKLEKNRSIAINAAAEELKKVLNKVDYWHEAMPAALFAVLESYTTDISVAAAIAFLNKYGFKIEGEGKRLDFTYKVEGDELVTHWNGQ